MNIYKDIHYKTLSFDDFQKCELFYQGLDGNHSPNDLRSFYQIDPNGLMGAYHKQQLIGSLYAANYDAHFASMGFFVLDSRFRNQHIGFDLLESMQDHITHHQMLFYVPQQYLKTYLDMGYDYAFGVDKLSITPPITIKDDYLISLEKIDFQKLLYYDRQHFPANRQNFLSEWLKRRNSRSFVYQKNGEILGFGAIAKTNTGYTIGPLFAENEVICLALIAKLCAGLKGPFCIFSPDYEAPNNWRKIVKAKEEALFIGLFRYGLANMAYQNIYGLTSIELG